MFELLRNAYRGAGLTAVREEKDMSRMLYKPNILAGVSHEVRTQMNSIVAFSYLMNNSKFSDNEKRDNHIM